MDDFTGPEGTTQTFTITLSDARAGETVTVNYAIVGGPGPGAATAPGSPDPDFEPVPSSDPLRGVLTFSPGVPAVVERTIDVSLLHDTLIEGPEELRLMLSSPSQAVLFDRDPVAGGVQAYGVGTIENVDPPVLSVDGFTGPEGTTQTFTITLSDARAGETVTVDYAISGGPGPGAATAPGSSDPADFEPVPDTGPLTATVAFGPLAPCQTSCTVEVSLLADYVPDEGDETLRLTLANPSGAVLFDHDPVAGGVQAYATGTIEDVDPPELSVDDFTGREGTNQSFTVTLANPRAGEEVTVDYVIAGAGAHPATDPAVGVTLHDYTAASGSLSGTLTFPYPLNQRSVGVSLLPDAISEVNETLRLTLSSPSRAVLFDRDPVAGGVQAYGVGTIEDAAAPWLFVGNTSAREGEPLTFTVTLCNPIPGQDVAVRYQTRAHSAAAGLDFVAADGTLSFPAAMAAVPVSEGCGAGVTADAKSLTVVVATLPDSVEESDEEVHLVLSGQPDHVGLGKSIGVGRIINVSAATVRVNDPTADEGDPLGFEISLVDNDGDPAVTTEDVTVHYETADRTATAGADYTPVPATPAPCLPGTAPPGVVTFARNSAVDPSPNRTHSVEVRTCPDTEDEDDETVALVLRLAAGTANAGLGDTEGIGTIEDADPPELRIADADAVEGETMTFDVTLVDSNGVETSTSEEVTVFAATEDGTAAEPGDYAAVSWRLTIPAGDTGVPFEVATSVDDINEPPETFRVVLSGARNAKVDKAVAVGTINPRCVDVDLDDDNNQPPTITLYDTTAVEGNTYFVPVTFSAPMCDGPQIIRQEISGEGLGTATCGVDFHVGLGPCDPPDEVAGIFNQALTTVPRAQFHGWGTEADSLDEDDEWFTIRWRWGPDMGPRYQGLGWFSARVTILDDDPLPRLSVADASADEGDAVAFSISLDRASGRPVTVRYRTVAATATGGTDYTEVDYTHTFVPGARFATHYVPTVDDGAGEGDETFLLEVGAPPDPSTPMNAVIVDGVAVGTILEGDLPEMRISDASGDEDSTMSFVVRLSEAAAQTVTVDYSTVERSGPRAAAEGADYQPVVRQQLEFAPGDTVAFARVFVNPDTDTEAAETFLVELADPSGASLADPSAVGTINSDMTCYDPTETGAVPPVVTVDSPTAVESDGQITFTVQLSEPICDYRAVFSIYPAGVFYDNFGSALPNVDFHYSGLSTIATVPALATEASFTVVLIDDDIDEPDEDIRMSVRSASGLEHVEAVGLIVDDDQAALSVAGDSGPEGGFLNFVIRLDGPSDNTVTVDYATEDATPLSAVAGIDYRARSGTAVIAEGELSATVAVFAPQDRLDEHDETFLLRLGNPTGGASLADADAVATGTITDDDPPPVVRVSDASVGEGATLVFAVTLDAPSGREVSVPVATRDGSARAVEGDYAGLASRAVVVFAPGVTRRLVLVQTLADSVVESAEVVWLDLGPVGDGTATIGDGTGRGVIRDVSDRRLSVSDAFVVEGGTLAFEVGFLEGPSSRDVTVRYETRSGTATAGDDYDDDFESAPRELRIVAGDTSATVSVPTVPDTLNEDNEQLRLVLSDPAGAVIVAGSAVGVIIDNDPLPELRVSNTEASEGVGASAVFTLSLSEASGRDVTVAYSTEDGTAAAGDDYTAVPDGEVVIAAGDEQATVEVALVDDDVAEDVETFRLVVSAAANAGRGDSVGVATVTDDDGLVQILVDDPAPVYEGDGASAAFTVRLSRAHPTEPVTVFYSTADGTATAGSDYAAATSELLVFWVGVTSETVTVPLINDDDVEEAETFRLVLTLSTIPNAELGDGEATVLVIDDDGLPTVSVTDAATQTEGSTASFTVTLSRAVPQEVTVDYATRPDPTAAAETAAVPGQDYTTTSGTVTFAARATEATVTVPLPDDSLDEHTETFWLRLANPTGATIADGTATGTIADDDPLPEITIADAGATEGTPLSFEVRLTPFSGRTVTVPWATEARPPGVDSASPGTDYTAASGTLTLAPGTTTAQVDVATLPDDVSEADETFLVQLGTPTNAALDDSTAVGAIRDDDGVPRVFIADTTVNEDDGPAIFTVTLSHPSSQPVTVEYNTTDGTAQDPDDYAPDQVRTLTIPATFTAGEISVFIADDDLTEGTETFTITLTNPVNAVIAEGAGTATGTILDDDKTSISIGDADAYENDGTIAFPLTLSPASASPTTVRYTTFDGTATQPNDYTAATATLTIPANGHHRHHPGHAHRRRFRRGNRDLPDTPPAIPAASRLAAADAVGVILDDDDLPVITAVGALLYENDGTLTYVVVLDKPSDRVVTVDYATQARI